MATSSNNTNESSSKYLILLLLSANASLTLSNAYFPNLNFFLNRSFVSFNVSAGKTIKINGIP